MNQVRQAWEAAKEVMATAKRVEEAAKNNVCERARVVWAQQTMVMAAQAEHSTQQHCSMCFERVGARTLLVLVPCGHRCVCAGCSGSLEQPCPICRENVREVMRVYD